MEEPPTATSTDASLPPRRSNSFRTLAVSVLVAFTLGAGLATWFAWNSGWLSPAATAPEPAQEQAAAIADAELVAAEASSAAALSTTSPGTIDSRMGELERRMNRLDMQAEAASGHAARAEGLLVAFAARRLIERGAPLGYLENQLQLRFGNAQPNAVRTIINSSRNPVTLDNLRTGLERLSTTAVNEPETLSGWERFRSEVSRLFVLRSAGSPSPQPEIRLERAQALLDDGRVEAAAALVERLPNSQEVRPWVADARRYVAVHDALDLVETAALLEPRQLIDGEGQPVRQRSPAAPAVEPEAAEAT
ncbi:hypothetical protein [Croceicoccus sp. BE223]|uniref:hypothetical protein n=1 Tax=Croceicoccus sp. BE223 TaxID=2817716 RepID=UPI0028580999|nr:hypothetical protein [Croceicoccus sp. BE223]MDR7104077.1 hypothetical protein [Croceicoccus sp. BE223]